MLNGDVFRNWYIWCRRVFGKTITAPSGSLYDKWSAWLHQQLVFDILCRINNLQRVNRSCMKSLFLYAHSEIDNWPKFCQIRGVIMENKWDDWRTNHNSPRVISITRDSYWKWRSQRGRWGVEAFSALVASSSSNVQRVQERWDCVWKPDSLQRFSLNHNKMNRKHFFENHSWT